MDCLVNGNGLVEGREFSRHRVLILEYVANNVVRVVTLCARSAIATWGPDHPEVNQNGSVDSVRLEEIL